MSFEWRDFLIVAREFSNKNNDIRNEAYMRSAISRAYYGAFCTSRDKAGLTNYSPNTNGDIGVHEKVIKTYKDSSDKTEKLIGKNLDELRRKRNNADYHKYIGVMRDNAERAIEMAEEILQNLVT